MEKNTLSVREVQEKDIQLIADYWFKAEPHYLESLGVDPDKLFTREQFTTMLSLQVSLPYNEKKAYALIWEEQGKAIGHSNVNPVIYGQEASMHLHIWNAEQRRKGYGAELIKMSLPYYFENLRLQKIYCEPYALNESPNKLLEKSGFTFIKQYITTPGAITFEQPVKRWEINSAEIN